MEHNSEQKYVFNSLGPESPENTWALSSEASSSSELKQIK